LDGQLNIHLDIENAHCKKNTRMFEMIYIDPFLEMMDDDDCGCVCLLAAVSNRFRRMHGGYVHAD